MKNKKITSIIFFVVFIIITTTTFTFSQKNNDSLLENSTMGKIIYKSRVTKYIETSKASKYHGGWFESFKYSNQSINEHIDKCKDKAHIRDPWYRQHFNDGPTQKSVRLVNLYDGRVAAIQHYQGLPIFFVDVYLPKDIQQRKSNEMEAWVDSSGKILFVTKWYGIDNANFYDEGWIIDLLPDRKRANKYLSIFKNAMGMASEDTYNDPIYKSSDIIVKRYQNIMDTIILKLE